jgi:hypothetical protein
VQRGRIYAIELDVPGKISSQSRFEAHNWMLNVGQPFYIRTAPGLGDENALDQEVSDQGVEVGTVNIR